MVMSLSLLSSVALALPYVAPRDPGPTIFRTKTRSRNLECERLSAEAGAQRYPGEVLPGLPRGDYIERSAVVCRERVMHLGTRDPRDEAILSNLELRVNELASATDALRPDLEDRTWLVEAYYPSAQVSVKLTFAAKNALAQQGLRVSDRTPTLGAGDIDVLTRMPPDEAYPAACSRYFANGSLRENDALLAVVSRDAKETALHAGLCSRGHWTWLR